MVQCSSSIVRIASGNHPGLNNHLPTMIIPSLIVVPTGSCASNSILAMATVLVDKSQSYRICLPFWLHELIKNAYGFSVNPASVISKGILQTFPLTKSACISINVWYDRNLSPFVLLLKVIKLLHYFHLCHKCHLGYGKMVLVKSMRDIQIKLRMFDITINIEINASR